MHDSERMTHKTAFLAQAGWSAAQIRVLAGDASFRRYDRATMPDGRVAVLMDAPPPEENIASFLALARWLHAAGFPAPQILAEDQMHGFLLLEDFGDDSFGRVLGTAPEREAELYRSAGRLLAALHLHENTLPDVPHYDRATLLREASLLPDWYLKAVEGEQPQARESFLHAWNTVLDQLPPLPAVLVLRDYHADNLMLLPEDREHAHGYGRVGLLDFQDALLGSPGYDLVSYLDDARRDVSPHTRTAVLEEYAHLTGIEPSALRVHCAVLGAQRNCKILGIFMRLTLRDEKPQYLDYLPRVWRLLEHELHEPLLAPVKAWFDAHLPAPMRILPPLTELKTAFARHTA